MSLRRLVMVSAVLCTRLSFKPQPTQRSVLFPDVLVTRQEAEGPFSCPGDALEGTTWIWSADFAYTVGAQTTMSDS